MGLGKCIQYDNTIQNRLMALRVLCAPLFVLPSPDPMATTDLSAVFIILPFPEYQIVEIIQYGAFSDWLLFLSLCLRILPIFGAS